MKPAKKIFLLLVVMLLAKFAGAQDINFSQFYDLPLLRNPSLAGIFSGDIRITSAYRNQWQSVTVPYRTFGLGAEFKKPIGENSNDFFTYGVQLSNDIAGDSKLSRTQAFPVFNYHKSLGDKNTYLSAGIMGGPVMQRFDPSRLTFDDQYVNGSYSTSNPTKQTFSSTKLTYWDGTAGLCFSSVAGENTRYYIGVGLFHFTEPKVAFQKQNDIILNKKWVVNGGFAAPLSDENRLIMYLDYFMQGGARQGQGGFMLNHDLVQYDEEQKISISGGVFYRWKDAFMPVVKLDYYDYSLGMSYDVNSSKLKSASQYRGAFEVTLSYKAFNNKYNTSANKVKCPLFF
ncbi:PorP/SprF family type IX secretion system membrane protein [Ferruginibacter sp. SUN106]|uniref:PorP/SprF family type IX secretion system membrane protein n=1 Tax=Ferruginibacter sp. SUN106 TaxID=2978348 RepID=UPI003D360886